MRPWDGRSGQEMSRGSASGTTDASGHFVVPHGLGTAPVWANANVNNSATYFTNIVSVDATNVTFVLVNRASGAAASTSYSVRWAAAA